MTKDIAFDSHDCISCIYIYIRCVIIHTAWQEDLTIEIL